MWKQRLNKHKSGKKHYSRNYLTINVVVENFKKFLLPIDFFFALDSEYVFYFVILCN